MNLALKVALLEKGVSQFQVCSALGWDPSKFSKVVNGWLYPKPEERRAISQYLGKPESALFSSHIGGRAE